MVITKMSEDLGLVPPKLSFLLIGLLLLLFFLFGELLCHLLLLPQFDHLLADIVLRLPGILPLLVTFPFYAIHHDSIN